MRKYVIVLNVSHDMIYQPYDTAKSNPIQFVDKLGDIFSKVTPVLGLVKKDEEVFTAFATNCAATFDVVFTNWRKVKSMSIRLAEALGLLTEVMSS